GLACFGRDGRQASERLARRTDSQRKRRGQLRGGQLERHRRARQDAEKRHRPFEQEITAALNSPDVKKRLADQNVAAQASTPEQATELLASEIKRWGDVIVRAKVPQQ
ncbi:MAG: hypothetical protein RLZZ296_1891, partial [Pseudomonadota bacterium]